MQIKRAAAIIGLLCLLAVQTACGVSETLDPVAAAAARTQDAGGVKMKMTIDLDDGSGKTASIVATGVFDKEQGELTMDLSQALEAAGAPAGMGSMKVLYLKEDGDTVMYMDVPAVSAMLGGKRWIRLNLDEAGKAAGIDLGAAMGQANQNPAEALDMLRASGHVEQVGTETIDGVATTKYEGAIDLAKAAELSGNSGDLVERLTAAGAPSTLPVEVWVGDDGLVRQLRMSADLAEGNQTGSYSITVGLSDFGTEVSVTAPPAAEVFDATPLAAMAGKAKTTA